VKLLIAIFFSMATLGFAAGTDYDPINLTVAPGSNPTQLNFAWQTTSAGKAVVQLIPAGGKAKTFAGTQAKVTATQFNADDASVATGTFADAVTVTGLTDATTYEYRVGDGKNWSATYPLVTHSQKEFAFLAVGDPQIGAKATGAKSLDADKAGWVDTLNQATTKFPNASFLLSLGDEVNDYNKRTTQDAEYLAYFSPAQLRSLPLAAIEGNHDFQMGEYYGFHYNQPNRSATYGTSYGNDGDYWFVYGNVLFLLLNSNTESVATHDVFLRDAIAKNPQTTWRIVAYHHALYSEADHVTDPDVIDRRANYGPVFDRYHIDLALGGHDHSYTRTYPIVGGKPQTAPNAAGTVYVTLNSGSGSKFYDWKDATPEVYSALRWQGKVPSYTSIAVSADQLTVTTYRTDDQSVVDTFSLKKAQ